MKVATRMVRRIFYAASSAKLCGIGLGTLRMEYIHQYNRLLDREKQPHSDFFINLSPEVEDEPFDLTDYDQYFKWDEAEYMRFRFIAARYYASRGHWDDAYAYVLRSPLDNKSQHQDTYNRNAHAWHEVNARINELIQEAEQVLEPRDRQIPQWPQFRPPRDSLTLLGHSTGSPSSMRGMGEAQQGRQRPPNLTPQKGTGEVGGRNSFQITPFS